LHRDIIGIVDRIMMKGRSGLRTQTIETGYKSSM